MVLAAYKPILRTPGLKMLMGASVVARLSVGFETLGVVLLVREATGSFALAGVAAAAMFTVVMPEPQKRSRVTPLDFTE